MSCRSACYISNVADRNGFSCWIIGEYNCEFFSSIAESYASE